MLYLILNLLSFRHEEKTDGLAKAHRECNRRCTKGTAATEDVEANWRFNGIGWRRPDIVAWACEEVLEVLLAFTKSDCFIPRIIDVELGKFKVGQS